MFTPAPGAPGTQSTTTFTLNDSNNVYDGLNQAIAYNGTDGSVPSGYLIADAAGNLFGTTTSGGANGYGTVFELANPAAGLSAPVTLANIAGTDGRTARGLVMDASGDLFGVTATGGSGNDGTVFEIAKTAGGYGALTTLATFTGSNGAAPRTLIVDAAGNLIGTTDAGGTNGDGTVFELAKTASGYGAPVTLVNFAGTNGSAPRFVVADAAGDLFGVTSAGGANGIGTVYEMVATGTGYNAPVTLASFTGANGATPEGRLLIDAAGDVFGTTAAAGPNGDGTVFELVKGTAGYGAPITLASFDGVNGSGPIANVVMDAEGDLFGTTTSGGANGYGTVFELVKTATGYSAPVTVFTFNGATGSNPVGLYVDASGNIYGNTQHGGSNGDGTTFEVSPLSATSATTTVINTDPPVAPTISGTVTQTTTTAQAPVTPFASTTVGDGNANANDTLIITMSGAGGTLADGAGFGGLVANSDGSYVLNGTAAAVTAELQALVFTPVAGAAASQSTTTFTLNDSDNIYTNTLLTSLDSTTGANPLGYLVEDALGNIFGTGTTGGTNNAGTIFELAQTAFGPGDPVTLFNFDGSTGASPRRLTIDANGDVFGVTGSGGAYGAGTVFEMVNGPSGYSAPVVLANFNGSDGAAPRKILIDANGNLLGTTDSGGAYGAGTLFELVNNGSGYGAPIVLASFGGATGINPRGLVADANGDLFGATVSGGANGKGTVFELVNTAAGYGALLTLTSFTGANGAAPSSGVVLDAVGNLYGTTASGGTNGFGTVYEMVNTGAGYSAPVVLANFNGTNGANAQSALIIDAAGDLIGTTSAGGAYNDGTVFELIRTATGFSAPVTLYTFNGANGIGPRSLLVDASGNLYGTTQFGGANNDGTVFELSPQHASGATTTVVNVDAAVAPTITGALAGQTTTREAALAPFAATVITDVNAGATDTLTITLSGIGGTLTDGSGFSGLMAHGTGRYTLTGTAAALTAELQALIFKAKAGAPNTTSTTGFSLSDVSSAYATATIDTTTSVKDYDPPLPPVVAITSTGGLTNQPVQTISGTADTFDAGTVVTVYDGTTALGTATVAANGSWSTTVTLSGQGAHTLVAKDTNAGGTGSSSGVVYTLDTVAPIAPTALADTAIVAGVVNVLHDTATQTLTGTAEAGATVTVYNGTTELGTVKANANTGAWSFVLGHLADGSYALTATATDAAGNTGTASTPLTFIVNTAAPAAPTGLADAAIANGYVNIAADTAAQTLTGSAAAGTTVTIFNNGTKLGTTTANATTGAWTYTLGRLATGVYALTATATNSASQTSPASATLGFTVLDTAVPAPTGLADAAIVAGYVNAARDTSAQTLTGSAQAGSTVTVYENGVSIGTTTIQSTGTWTYLLGALASGTYAFTATATDVAGNVSAASSALSFKVMASAPSAPTNFADASDVNGYVNIARDTTSQAITGSAAPGTTVTVYDNGVKLGTVTANATTGQWSYTLGKLASGSQSITATATDAAGNVSASSTPFTFTVLDTVVPAPTALADTAIVAGYVNAANDTAAQVLTGMAQDGSVITIYNNGIKLGTTTTVDGTVGTAATSSWSYTLGSLASGAYKLTATATDVAGNVSAVSTVLAFTVVATAPAAPISLADTKVVNGYVNAANDVAAQAVTGKAAAGTKVTVYDHGTRLGTVTAGTTGVWSYTLGVLSNGAHAITATATDVAGNVSAASSALNFTVDTVAPVPAVTNITYNAATKIAGLTGVTDPNLVVSIYSNGSLIASTTANASGVWTYNASVTGSGTYQFAEKSTDAAGNIGASSGVAVLSTKTGVTLSAGAGSAVVLGAAGDTLAAGSGQDLFVFHGAFGKETITGFSSAAGDALQFDKTAFSDWSYLLGATKQVGSDLMITLDANDIVTLKNVTMASFTQSNAHFV